MMHQPVCLRETDTVEHYGGDEFMIIISARDLQLRGISTHLISRQVADKIRYALNLAFVIDDLGIHISCSIGIALYSKDGNDKNTLIKHADSAIYMAKSLGKNCVKHFSDID